jgi:Ca2+-binding RTX toxin-like protein
MIGINLSGAEFGKGNWYGRDYIYPSESDLNYYADRGIALVCLPFRWERIQTTLNGPLNGEELGRLQSFLDAAATSGVKVIVDLHNYGRYKGGIVNTPEVPIASFVDFWTRMAGALKDYPALLGYDLMNEPHDMRPGGWPRALQSAVDAIRKIDMGHNIYVQGTGWSSTWNWPEMNGDLRINDPADRLFYEAHIYFDSDNSGTYRKSYDDDGTYPMFGVDRLTPFTDWLKQTGNKGFIGEYGAPKDDPRWLTVMDNFLKEAEAEGLDTAYFGAGPWSSSYHAALVGPGGLPNPQLATLLGNRTSEGFTVEGTAIADTLTGSVADDRLAGFAGNDTLTGFAGKDLLDGGAGSDTMVGGGGNDSYFVDNIRDRVTELAGQGTDLVNAYISYTLPNNVENLYLRGGATTGGTGNALNNRIEGNDAANPLNGGSGNDTLIGRGGSDRLTGGSGSDIFDYNLASDSRGAQIDTILDFVHGADRIDVSTIDANSRLAGNQAFRFIGANAFSGSAGELRSFTAEGNTIIEGDTNGDKIADLAIRLVGASGTMLNTDIAV